MRIDDNLALDESWFNDKQNSTTEDHSFLIIGEPIHQAKYSMSDYENFNLVPPRKVQ